MPDAGRRQVVTVTSALALVGATLALLICTEPMASRFWFAVAVTTAIVAAVAFLSRLEFALGKDVGRGGRI